MKSLFVYKAIGVVSREIFLYAHSIYFFLYSLYKRRSDRAKLTLIKKYVSHGDTVIDIGAHIGFYTKFFAQLVESEGRVFAYEPSSENYNFLTRNIRTCPHVRAFQKAVGSHHGTLSLFISPTLNVDHRTYATDEDRKQEMVPMISIDEEYSRYDWKNVALVKMDIQGYEYEALKGMRRLLLEQRPVVIMELWPWGLLRAKSSAEEVVRLMEELEYDCRLIHEETGSTSELQLHSLRTSEEVYYDLLCLPR